MEQIIENLKQKARESWSGEIGEERAENLIITKTILGLGRMN